MDDKDIVKEASDAIWKPNLGQRAVEKIVKRAITQARADERDGCKKIVKQHASAWPLASSGDLICREIDARGAPNDRPTETKKTESQ